MTENQITKSYMHTVSLFDLGVGRAGPYSEEKIFERDFLPGKPHGLTALEPVRNELELVQHLFSGSAVAWRRPDLSTPLRFGQDDKGGAAVA